MKRFLLTAVFALLAISMAAQGEYHYLYWFDSRHDQQATGVAHDSIHLNLEAQHLEAGFHTVHLMLRDSNGHWSMPRSRLFYRAPYGAERYTLRYICWFDQDYDHCQEGLLGNGHLMIDADSLVEGVHTVNIRVGNGLSARVESHFFYHTPANSIVADSVTYICWFDQDYDSRQEGLVGDGLWLIDASALPDGMHTLNVRLGSRGGSSLESRVFYKTMPEPDATDTLARVAYWFDGEQSVHYFDNMGGLHLLEVPSLGCGDNGHIHFLYKDGYGNSSSILSKPFIMMDSDCCIPPLFVTVDSITTTTARLHWDYNRMENFTLIYSAFEFDPDTVAPSDYIAINDTVFHFDDLDSGNTYYYAVRTDCYTGENPWVTGQWSTICRSYIEIDTTVCDQIEWHGNTLTESGLYVDTVLTENGYGDACDSIFRLTLTVNHSSEGVDSIVACRNHTWIDGITYTENSHNSTFTINNSIGCDSTVTLYLTVNQPEHIDSSIVDTACDSYLWHGVTYWESGTFLYEHSYDDSPCPSVDTLDLTILPSYSVAHTASVLEGDSYLWFGQTYNQAGTYMMPFQSVDGCDSIHTLTLSLVPPASYTSSGTICQGEEWQDGHFFLPSSVTSTLSGQIMMRDTLHSAQGSDSVIYLLQLTVLPSNLDNISGLYPTADSIITEGTVALGWNAVDGATGYRIYLWREGEEIPNVPWHTTSHCGVVVDTYDNGSYYNWRVEAVNPCDTVSSATRQFLINKQPVLTLMNHTLDFGEVVLGQSTNASMSVIGTNLTDSVRMTVVGTDAQEFSLVRVSLPRHGGNIGVIFHPTTAKDRYTAYLLVQSDTLTDTVLLSGQLANYYVFTLSVADSIMPPSTPVDINGTLHNILGEAIADETIDIRINVMGFNQTFTVNTGTDGSFSATYTPVTSECGYYTVQASRHGIGHTMASTSFNIPGISWRSNIPVWNVEQYDTVTGTIQIQNRCGNALHSVSLHASSSIEGMNIVFDTVTLSPFQTVGVPYTLVGTVVSSGDVYLETAISASYSEGNLGNYQAYYYCYQPVPDLQIAFDTIECAVVPGEQRVVDVALYNNTDSIFRDVQLLLPGNQNYIQLLRTDSIYNMAPHDSLFIPLLVSFPVGTPLAPVTGEVYAVADNTVGQYVPFVVNVVSDATGSLRVLVSNEYTYYNNGPHVSEAEVTLIGYYNLDTVAHDITGSSGQLIFDSLPEGYYNLYVEAPDNDPYQAVVQIRGGQQTFRSVDLEFQAVTYTWVVYQKPMDDSWGIRFDAEYKTNVPKPVLVIDVPDVDVPWDGSFAAYNVIVTNHGLVDAYDATLEVPTSDTYEVIPLFDKIDTIYALSSVVIPCRIRNKRIVEAIEAATSGKEYTVDTIDSYFYRTRKKTRWKDTVVYIPVSQWEEDTINHVVMRYDTIRYLIPTIEIDTIETIVEREGYRWVTVTDTLIRINKTSKYIYGSCETGGYKLYATFKCNNEGHYVQTGTAIVYLDCEEDDDNPPTPDPPTPDPPTPNPPNPDPPTSDSTHHSDTTHYTNRYTVPGLPFRPGTRPWVSNLPSWGIPSFNFNFNRPVITIDQECIPCWQKVAQNSVDCLGSLLLDARYDNLLDDAVRYRVLHTDIKRELRAGEAINESDIRRLYDATQTSVQRASNAVVYKYASRANDLRSIAYDIIGSDYDRLFLDIIAGGVGIVNPVAGTTITCVNDAIDAVMHCIHEDKIEIPVEVVNYETNDTIFHEKNICTAVKYYDTIRAIVSRITYDEDSIITSFPEVKQTILRYLVTTDSAVVTQVRELYDTTELVAISRTIIKRYVDRWNRTMDYLKKGWIVPSLVPDGYSLDYVYLDTNTLFALVDMELEALEQGYESIDMMSADALNYLATLPVKKSVCAGVSLQFEQDVAMTREAFEGVLSIKNPNDTVPLRDLVTLFTVTDTAGNDCSDKFDISVIKRTGVDMDGNIAANATGIVTVRFVPLLSAAPQTATPYLFGGTVEYTSPYTQLQMTDNLIPTTLTINPSPHLQLDYFIPHDIISDDPLTSPVIEAMVPATIGLRVLNDGYGEAKNIRVSSIQPEITENRLGLAVEFHMLNTMRNGTGSSQPLSDISLGNLTHKESQTLEYYLASSLLGTITVKDINVIHNSSIDDRDMSLVDAQAHRLVKTVLQYGNGADQIHDFLTTSITQPDSIFFSNGGASQVHLADSLFFDHFVEPGDTVVQVTMNPDSAGWSYGTTDDPGQGKYEILSCVRDDNVEIPLDNIWLTFVDLPTDLDPVYVNKMHLVDTLSAKRTVTYNVTFQKMKEALEVDTVICESSNISVTPLDSVLVRFNKAIVDSTFTYADMSLKCNNGANLMDNTVEVHRIDDSTFSVMLAHKNIQSGFYVLKVMADSVVDADGRWGVGGKQTQWMRLNDDPSGDTVIYVKLGVVGDSIFSKEEQSMVVTHPEVTHVKLGFRVEPTAERIELYDADENLIGTFDDSAEPSMIYRLTTGTYIVRAIFFNGDTFQQTLNFENVIHY